MLAFYRPISLASDEQRFEATGFTVGPWSALHQHGGPPCALLAGAVARLAAPGHRVVRFAGDGDVTVAMRPLVPLVEGVPTLSLESLLVVADSASGVSRGPIRGRIRS